MLEGDPLLNVVTDSQNAKFHGHAQTACMGPFTHILSSLYTNSGRH